VHDVTGLEFCTHIRQHAGQDGAENDALVILRSLTYTAIWHRIDPEEERWLRLSEHRARYEATPIVSRAALMTSRPRLG
jgi:hypothetical protein